MQSLYLPPPPQPVAPVEQEPLVVYPPVDNSEACFETDGAVKLKANTWTRLPLVERYNTFLYVGQTGKGLAAFCGPKTYHMTFEINARCDSVQDVLQWRLVGYRGRKIDVAYPHESSIRYADIGYTGRDKNLIRTWNYPVRLGDDCDVLFVPQVRCKMKNKDKVCTIKKFVWKF